MPESLPLPEFQPEPEQERAKMKLAPEVEELATR